MKDLIAEFFQFFNPMAKLLFLLFVPSPSYPFRNAWKDQKLISKKKVELFINTPLLKFVRLLVSNLYLHLTYE